MTNSNKNLDISNKSYTNKDFASIYNELLSYAEKISYRFSPVSANEADPFIILLKLVAFVADKINYNVDKNILERFMSSCTQETSMQELTEMMGYHMHYYLSATSEVVFTYSGDLSNLTSNIIIPKNTVLIATGNIQYITTAAAEIDLKTKQSLPTSAIQGILKRLKVLDGEVIQVENIDANNRIYFPESHVAENGVYIRYAGNNSAAGSEWTLYSNLNEGDYLSRIYKFGYDSSRKLPYIEFPEWINEIIREGLIIDYVISAGSAGNIAAKSMESASLSDDIIPDSDITAFKVINYFAATNGADPETITASYKGFKKLVGTYDALITCRDYAAKIFNMLDNNNYVMVSNAIVSDRRNDINYSVKINTVTDAGKQSISDVIYANANDKDGKTITDENGNIVSYPAMTAYDLCLYPFNPIKSTQYLFKDKAGGYEDSFNLVSDSVLNAIKFNLEDEKAISHNYKELAAGDIVAIPIYLKLTAIINTADRISKFEGDEIIYNIKSALIDQYNLRTLDFGKEISYNDLITTIENADFRIKSVILYEPEQTPKFRVAESSGSYEDVGFISLNDNNENDLSNQFKLILLKNVISGKVNLFSYDTDFQYRYDYTNCQVIESKEKITTCANINISASADSSDNKLKSNEVVQFIAPKYDAFVTYPYGVLYHLTLDSGDSIKKGSDYKLNTGDILMLGYADSKGVYQYYKYQFDNETNGVVEYHSDNALINSTTDWTATGKKNVIISPNFDLFTNNSRITSGDSADKTVNDYKFHQIAANEEIVAKQKLEDNLNNAMYYVYWIMNNSDNRINWDTDKDSNKLYYILREGEYFYYSDLATSYLREFGSGTSIKLGDDSMKSLLDDWSIDGASMSALNIADDISQLKSSFKLIDLRNSEQSLNIQLNEIKTFTEGDTLQFINAKNALISYKIPDNIFSKLNSDELLDSDESYVAIIKYKYAGLDDARSETLSDKASLAMEDRWKVRGLLDVNCGPNLKQYVSGSNKIYLTSNDFTFTDLDFVDHKIKGNKIYANNQFTIPGNPESDLIDDAVSIDDVLVLSNTYLKSNIDIALGGGENLDLHYISADNNFSTTLPKFLTYNTDLDISNILSDKLDGFYSISIDKDFKNAFNLPLVPKTNSATENSDKAIGVTIVVPGGNDQSSIASDIKFNLTLATDTSYTGYIMNSAGVKKYPIPVSESEGSEKDLITGVTLAPGINTVILFIGANVSSATFGLTTTADSNRNILISDLKMINDLNPCLGLPDDIKIEAMLTTIDEYKNKIPKISTCNFLEESDYIRSIELTEDFPLTSAQAFYDPNNIANGWVIPKIDFDNSIIKIASSSLKR